jgi:hypothetical protein
MRLIEAAPGVLAYERGDHVVAINTTARPAEAPPLGDLVLTSEPGALTDDGRLAPNVAVMSSRPVAVVSTAP